MQNMPLDFVQLEFWTYGFAGSIYLATAGWPLGIISMWWFVMAYLGIHREDDPIPGQFDFHFWWLFSTLSGLLVGFSIVWSLGMDRLVDSEYLNYRNSKRYLALEWTLTVFYATGILAGYYFLVGHFSDGLSTLPLSTARAIGITLIVVFGLLGVGLFIWMFFNRTDRRETTLNAKYLIALALLITAAPVAYDYALLGGWSPWHGAWALGAIVIYWLLMILWIGFFDTNPTTGSLRWAGGFLKSSDREHTGDRFYSKRQGVAFLAACFSSQFVLYLVAWLVDTHPWTSPEPHDLDDVVIAIGVTSLVEAILFPILYYFGAGKWWPSAPARMEVSNYDVHVAKTPSLKVAYSVEDALIDMKHSHNK